MSKTNEKLKLAVNDLKANKKKNKVKLPKPNTKNISGKKAYKLEPYLELVSLLNTSKVEPQFYRKENEIISRLEKLIDKCAKEDLFFTCQIIIYSRCLGEGLRTINQLASIFIAKHLSGSKLAKRFYSLFNKETKKGGVIFRPDDMSEILEGFAFLNKSKLTNGMKKGFKRNLENLSEYQLLKYKSKLIDVINLVKPNPAISKAFSVLENGDANYPTLDAIMKGLPVKANTWETNQSEAGQIVAKAVKEGKLSKEEASKVLTEAKADNWKELLDTNKLGILAAIRNLRNILINNPKQETIDKLCSLISNPKLIREGKIFPYQLDVANEIMLQEFNSSYSREISKALLQGYELAVPNLKELLTGSNLVILDCSGSMTTRVRMGNKYSASSCLDKASLIAATIAKATNADVIRFGNRAVYDKYNINTDLFSLAKHLRRENLGGTNLATAWNLARESKRKYDRVFILSDNECNRGNTYKAYKEYLQSVGNPYVYSVDLASYGTTQLVGDNVRYYYGYGLAMFDDIATSEFNPNHHIEKIKKVKF